MQLSCILRKLGGILLRYLKVVLCSSKGPCFQVHEISKILIIILVGLAEINIICWSCGSLFLVIHSWSVTGLFLQVEVMNDRELYDDLKENSSVSYPELQHNCQVFCCSGCCFHSILLFILALTWDI